MKKGTTRIRGLRTPIPTGHIAGRSDRGGGDAHPIKVGSNLSLKNRVLNTDLKLTDGHVFVGDAQGRAADVAMTGDATIDDTGALTVTGLQGVPVAATAPTDLYVLTFDSGAGMWKPAAAGGGGTGDVVGPASATDLDFVQFDGVTGKLIKDGGLSRDTDGTLAANSDSKIPSQKAVKTYVNAGDAATLASAKAYTDAVAQGLSIRASCRLATAAALPANAYSNGSSGVGATLTAVSFGVLTVDGSAVALGDRILVKDEVAGSHNGIYAVTTLGALAVLYVLTRATDYDQSADIFEGTFSFIVEGTANVAKGFVLTTSGAITVGTTALTFTQFSSAGGAAVSSVFGRTGVVVAATNDYSFSQISGTAAAAQLPLGTSSTVGAVKSDGGITTSIDGSGVITALAGGTIQNTGAIDVQWFGDGSDGVLTASSGTTTLTRDTYYSNITLSSTAKINTAGWKLFWSGTLDISAAGAGAIFNAANNGGNATGAVQGAGGAASGNVGSLAAAALGGNGAAGATGVGAAGGVGVAQTVVSPNSGASGAGGAVGATSGGASRAAPALSVPADVRRLQQELAAWSSVTLRLIAPGASAPGGSSGAGDGVGTGGPGGGGGAGGQTLYLAGRTIARGTNITAGIIRALGGNGGNAANGSGGTNRGGGGGGAGGAGGWIYLVFRSLTGSTITNALDATGGDGGAGANGVGTGIGGDGGGSGGGGRIDVYNLGAGTQTILAATAAVAGNAHSSGTGGAAKTATAQQVNL